MIDAIRVDQWIGPILIGDNETEVFLGRELSSRRTVSERTAELVDEEVKRVIQTAFDRAKQVLTDNRDLLDKIAAAAGFINELCTDFVTYAQANGGALRLKPTNVDLRSLKVGWRFNFDIPLAQWYLP